MLIDNEIPERIILCAKHLDAAPAACRVGYGCLLKCRSWQVHDRIANACESRRGRHVARSCRAAGGEHVHVREDIVALIFAEIDRAERRVIVYLSRTDAKYGLAVAKHASQESPTEPWIPSNRQPG